MSEASSNRKVSARRAKRRAIKRIVSSLHRSLGENNQFFFCGFQGTHFQEFKVENIQKQNIDNKNKDPSYSLPRHHQNHQEQKSTAKKSRKHKKSVPVYRSLRIYLNDLKRKNM